MSVEQAGVEVVACCTDYCLSVVVREAEEDRNIVDSDGQAGVMDTLEYLFAAGDIGVAGYSGVLAMAGEMDDASSPCRQRLLG